MVKYVLHVENPPPQLCFFACIYFLLNQNNVNGLSDLLCFDVKENGSFRYVHWEFLSLCGSNRDLGMSEASFLLAVPGSSWILNKIKG